jgi:cbb3-type cytochrome oxidase subunit 3
MKQEALSFFSNTDLTAFASILFAGAFVAILFAVFRKKNEPYYKYMSEIPLQEDQNDR